MHFPADAPVRPEKLAALHAQIQRLELDLELIEEQFVRGGGPGGQKINKTNNCVVLRYPPLALTVRCQRERLRSLNRFVALRQLVDLISARLAPERECDVALVARQRNRQRRRLRSRKRAAEHSAASPAVSLQTEDHDAASLPAHDEETA
jgi:protein subunit release factor B